jgi:hypothetical protein
MRNHYRGHKMSLWLNLIPQLHRPGEGDDVSMRHHHFQEEDDQYYDGNALIKFTQSRGEKGKLEREFIAKVRKISWLYLTK